jgi:hypothetical protein
MVGIITQGRLGNQMFQYAFIYAISKRINKPFFIISYNSLHYFKLHEDLEKNNTKNILKFIAFNLLKKSTVKLSRKTITEPLRWIKDWVLHKNIFIWHNTTDEKNYLLTYIKDNILYTGFFASENYFIHLKKDIIMQFEIKPNYQIEFNKTKKEILNRKIVALHIRRTDFKFFGNEQMGGTNVILPISYYQKCLTLIENIDEYNVVFISDDIEFVKNQFGMQSNYFYENNSEIIDFQLLLNANIVIIANSTFSWWAAWLNQKTNKIVYAPNYYLGFKVKKFYPAGIKIDNWQWVDFN